MERETEMLAGRTSESPEATEALGELLGRTLGAGSVIALVGDLGVGKTCFVRGLGKGLGLPPGVASPTYTLMQAHEGGRLPLYHFDAWMEGREAALFEDGGDEWLRGEGIAVVEWAGRVEAWLPRPCLWVELGHLAPERRSVRIGLALGPEPADGAHGALRSLIAALHWPTGMPADPDFQGGRVNRPARGPLGGH